MDKFWKQPSETFPIAADFSNVLDSGETIVLGSSSVTAYDPADQDVTNTIIVNGSLQVSGDQLVAKVQAGDDNIAYKITFKAVTSDSNTYEKDIQMDVKEI